MRALTVALGAWMIAGCGPGSGSAPPPIEPVEGVDYTVTGQLPADADVDQILSEMPDGAFAVVGDPVTSEIAVIQAGGSNPEARIASAEFSATAPRCIDCVGSCATLTRTINVTLTHTSGINGETYTSQQYSALNFTSPVTTPSSWTQNVGATQLMSTQGTLATCGTFYYFFDVIGPDQKRVFVDMIGHDGNFGGAAAADAICQADASAAGLGGSWKAWISDKTTNPATRFFHNTAPYVLVDGTVIANDWTDLTDGTLAAGIDKDQFGNSVGSVFVWTGTAKAGVTATGTPRLVQCNGFVSANAADKGVNGTTGLTTSGKWSNNGTTITCNTAANLMCFEQ